MSLGRSGRGRAAPSNGLPRRVGKWAIERDLGAGGMGSVYLANRKGDRAALKMVHPGLAADPHFRDRFRREVAVSALVRGQFVAKLIDADVDAAQPWLATEFVEGPTLAQHIASDGPIGAVQCTALALALASALQDIHQAGVIHRDLKPSNVILAPGGPVVIDFGIAAAVDATSLTQTGAVMGSAGWMAPEQIKGEPIHAPADVFAWGATVCFAATGSPPFGIGRTEQVAYRALHEEPALTGVPDVLLPLVAAALSRNEDARPELDEIISELGAVVASAMTIADSAPLSVMVTQLWGYDNATLTHPVSSPRPRAWSRLTVLSILAILLALGAVGTWVVWPRDIPSTTDAAQGTTTTPPPTASWTTTSTTARPSNVTIEPLTPPSTTGSVRPSEAELRAVLELVFSDPDTSVETSAVTSVAACVAKDLLAIGVSDSTLREIVDGTWGRHGELLADSRDLCYQPAPPEPPALESQIDPRSTGDIARILGFAESNSGLPVRMELRWPASPEGPLDSSVWDGRDSGDGSGSVYFPGPCEGDVCPNAMFMALWGIGFEPSANLYFEDGSWILQGRFIARGVSQAGGVSTAEFEAVADG